MKSELEAEEFGESSEPVAVEQSTEGVADAPKRGRGRPKGYPKTGGRKAGVRNWSQPEIRAELLNRSNAIDVLASIASGEKLFVAGPTGKPAWRYPTMKERLHALDLVFAKVAPNLTASELTGADGSALIPQPGSDGEAAIRKAMLEHVLAHKSAENEGASEENHSREKFALKKSSGGLFENKKLSHHEPTFIRTSHTSESQPSDSKLPISEPPESQIPTDDSDIPISNSSSPSITDVEQIQRWDTEQAATGASALPANTKTFSTGFYWRKRYDEAIRREVYDLFDASNSPCGTRQSRERADRWCEQEGAI